MPFNLTHDLQLLYMSAFNVVKLTWTKNIIKNLTNAVNHLF